MEVVAGKSGRVGRPAAGWMTWRAMRAPVVAILLLLGACGDETAYPVMSLFSAGAGERSVWGVRYDTLWAYGGVADTVLASPGPMLAAEDGGVYVLDYTLMTVNKFSASGTVVWSWGQQGEGPGELKEPRAMTPWRQGGVIIADSGNRRLTYLSSAGTLVEEKPIGDDSFVLITGLVELPNGEVVLSTNGPAPWLLVAPETDVVRPLATPWEGFGRMHPIQWAGKTAGNGNRWVFGFQLGNGFFVMNYDSVAGQHPYVEHVDFPEVLSRSPSRGMTMTGFASEIRVSAHSLAIKQDTLLALPGGETRARRRVLDKYDLATGRYVGSQLLPWRTTSFAVYGNDRIFLASRDESGLYPTVVAFQLSEATASDR